MGKKKATKMKNKVPEDKKEESTVERNSVSLESDDEMSVNEEEADDVEEEEDLFEGPKDVGGFTVLGEFKAKDKTKVERVLPDWLRLPILIKEEGVTDFAGIPSLDSNLIQKLKDNGLENCFPVQLTVIPELLAQCKYGIYGGDAGFRPRDICVSAPTGSGKTLTFVLPIIQALQDRVVPHVRALVILPVRDLAIQVYKVFQQYIQGTSLKAVLLAGKKEFHSEQVKLVRKRPHADISEMWTSLADIVVATKGRLLDHIIRTEGFDLTHLRFLVIDEADRQMEDVYDDWLSQVETAAYTPKPGAYSPYHRERPGPLTVASTKKIVMHTQKLLFSATLSQNPEKLEQMNLYLPLLFAAVAPGTKCLSVIKSSQDVDAGNHETQTVDMFSTPALLKEKFMDCKKAEKPLILFHFVLNLKFQQVLCFTNSVESTHRLYLLAKQMEGLKVAELSSGVHTEKRERIIRKFSRGDLQLLICSDVMTRGMDIENVQYVISYDAPTYIETYIHRVGRTARANRPGTAITLLEGKEMFHFKKMLRESGRWSKLKRITVNNSKLEPLVPHFSKALKILPMILKEQRKQLKNL
uniref:ATP-dependent RNA helicase n=1 Tax=Arion vulgaris TaxID=1028688 RepID=A0A0B6ZF66_9EUPU